MIFVIFILNEVSKYVKLVAIHTTASSAESRRLASACRGDQIRTGNILKTAIMTTGRNTIIAPLINVPFSVQVGYKNFQLCVLRDTGWSTELEKVGKLCSKSFSTLFNARIQQDALLQIDQTVSINPSVVGGSYQWVLLPLIKNQRCCQHFIGSPNIFTSPQGFACGEPFQQRADKFQ